MTLKEQIQADFIQAFKEKNETKKRALSMLKSKIVEAEKMQGAGTSLEDVVIMKVVIASVKQRKQSIEEFKKAGREDMAAAETAEMEILMTYMPPQMSEAELREKVSWVLRENDDFESEARNKKIGVITGKINKNWNGLFDQKMLQKILNEVC